MKKLLCMLIVIIFVFGLVSCKEARYGYLNSSLTDISSESNDSSFDNSTYDSSNDSSENSEESDIKKVSTITPLLWKVTGKDSNGVIYLFGSIHVADESAYPLPNAVMTAFDSCDALAVECDTKNANIDYNKFYKSMMYKDGSTIDKHISADIYSKASKIVEEKYGKQTLEMFMHYKPIMWQIMIDQIFMSECDLTPEHGIDSYFLDLADEENKKVMEIESIDIQNKLLSGFSEELQEILLSEAVNTQVENYSKGLNELYEAWIAGDIKLLEALALGEAPVGDFTDKEKKLIDEYNKEMITDRNIGMFNKAKEYLKDNMEVFYVVGEAHMIGENGIVKLLTDAGYTVERVSYNSGVDI